jgi:hypothetical protein
MIPQKYEIKAVEVAWAVLLATAVWVGQFFLLSPNYSDWRTWGPVFLAGVSRVAAAALHNAIINVTTVK